MRLCLVLVTLLTALLIPVPSASAWVTPCTQEDPRFLVDKEFPAVRSTLPPLDKRLGVFVPTQVVSTAGWGTVNASPTAYQLTLWEALAGGSGAGADYVLTIARANEWFEVLWKGSTAGSGLGAYLRRDGATVTLVLMRRADDGTCQACPRSVDVERYRWDSSQRTLVADAAYQTRCKY